MLKTKKIVIADDMTLVREALKILVSSNPAYVVCAEARSGPEAVDSAGLLKPDLVMIEPFMATANGKSVIQDIKKQSPATKILALTAHKTDEQVLAVFKAGADGYVPKDAPHKELMLALENIFSGRIYFSPAISKNVIAGYLEGRKYCESPTSWDKLTERERLIFKMIAEGGKNKDIADCLCISRKTVETHRANLMRKLGLHSASSITALAYEKGLITM